MPKKKKSRRERTKYPNLDPNMNIKARKDYLEGWRYVDGVKDTKGNEVIRPLTEEEKKWLDKFEAETVVTDFYHTQELKDLKKNLDTVIFDVISNSNDKEVVAIRGEILTETDDDSQKKLIAKMKRLCKKLGKNSSHKRIVSAKKKLQKAKDVLCFYPSDDDQKALYKDNNSRNTCLFNHSKKNGDLIKLDLFEYDRFVSDRLCDIDPEDLLIGLDGDKKKKD